MNTPNSLPTIESLANGLPVMPVGMDVATALIAEIDSKTLTQAAKEVIDADHALIRREDPTMIRQVASSYTDILGDDAEVFVARIAAETPPRNVVTGDRAFTERSDISSQVGVARQVKERQRALSHRERMVVTGLFAVAIGAGMTIAADASIERSKIDYNAAALQNGETSVIDTHTKPDEYAFVAGLGGIATLMGGILGAGVGGGLKGKFAHRNAKREVRRASR